MMHNQTTAVTEVSHGATPGNSGDSCAIEFPPQRSWLLHEFSDMPHHSYYMPNSARHRGILGLRTALNYASKKAPGLLT